VQVVVTRLDQVLLLGQPLDERDDDRKAGRRPGGIQVTLTDRAVSRETAAALIASWVNYVPLTEWDPRLPDRSGAGGRGAKNRKSA
jgi:hypothetical protein